jgi:rare lipoprotein A
MTRTLLGVAHKRLPCGTQVAVLYRGRRITVPVVDRGPFRHGTTWDLTAATAEALRFEHTDRVGAVRITAAD